MIEYKEYELKDVCSRLSSGKGIPAAQVHDEGKFPVYGGNGLRGYTDHSNFVGSCAIIGRHGAFCGNVRFFSGEAYMTEHAVVVCANPEHNTHYLAYLLSMMNLGRLSGQSAQPGLSAKTLAKQRISLPSLEVQNKVVAILETLENKIALNNKINDNLEQQARNVFIDWFVLFSPFANEEFVTSPIGTKIPATLKMVQIANIPHLLETGKRPKGGAASDGIPSVGAENVKQLGKFDFSSNKYIPVEFAKKQKTGKK